MLAKKNILNKVLVLLIAGLSACENDLKEIEAYTKESKEVEVGKGIKAIFSQSGIMKAILEAPIMYRVKGDSVYTEFPEKIHVTFYNDKTGVIDNEVRANYARYYEFLHKVYMKDSVVVYNATDTLYAQDLWWDQNQEIFFTTNPVKIRTPTQKLNGTGFTSKADFSKQSIENPVGDVAIPEDINQQ